MRKTLAAMGLIAILGLSACGDNDLERGASGALIGAGGTALLGGSVVGGAIIGGAAGVFCDDFTNVC